MKGADSQTTFVGRRAVQALRRTAFALASLVVLLPALAGAQAPEPVAVIPAIYSSDTMTRNADLALAGAVLATTAVDKAIAAAWVPRPDSVGARTARLSKFVLFDVPVVAYLVGLNHEGGHIARTRERALPYSFDIVGSPWSARPFELIALDPRIFDELGTQTGGVEASRRFKDRSEAWLWRSERVAPGHALATVVASLDLPIYAWHSLSSENTDPLVYHDGDPLRVLEIVARRNGLANRDAFDDVRSGMRRRATWNLADAVLWSLTFGIVRDHLWRGEVGVRVRWLTAAGVQWLPGVRYEWTPIGAEYSLRSHYRTATVGGIGYVRWTERLAGERQVGAGGSASWRTLPLQPRVDVDTWSHTRDGAGLHAAATVEFSRWAPGTSTYLLAAGAKSAGHVHSLPPEAGAYVSAGLVVRMW